MLQSPEQLAVRMLFSLMEKCTGQIDMEIDINVEREIRNAVTVATLILILRHRNQLKAFRVLAIFILSYLRKGWFEIVAQPEWLVETEMFYVPNTTA